MAPNIILVVIDDMPRGLLQSMPFTQAEIQNKGANYVNGTITTPLCGPSRSTLFTGKVAHNHGVWGNAGGTYGGWKAMQPYEATALPVALQAVGYRTGLYGKYQNGWNKNWTDTGTPPPGWDRFRAILPDSGGDGDYYNYNLVGTGTTDHYGSTEADYSTDVIFERAANFIANTNIDNPFFCYVAPYGVHANFTPAPRHVDTYTPSGLNPAVNSDNSLRAPWLRTLPLVDEARVLAQYKGQHETIKSVDDGIAALFAAMTPERIANTLVILTGDNGLQRGEQRLSGKNVGYPASTAVPMLARWDGQIAANSNPLEIVTNADITKTIVDAAGATMADLDGMPVGTRTSGVLLEGKGDNDGLHNGWIGWKTRNWLYLNYGGAEGEELYKIICDKHAITNVAADYPDKVAELRYKATSAASPLPPGFTL